MAPIPKLTLSRRELLSAGSFVAAAALWPTTAPAQQPVPDGFRPLRALPGVVPLRGPEREMTAIWGYSGVVPGPTLRIKRGEELKVRLVNALPVETTIHWHGVRLPNAFDGTALTQRPVQPGASFDYRFRPPDAGTYWYRAAPRTAQSRALHGPLIVHETEPPDVDRDVTLILDAWPPAADGPKDAAPVFTLNGLPALDIAVVANERIRLRLINAADSRLITLRIDRHPVMVMAIDGQPAEPFAAREGRITLSPGNRADVFVDAVLERGSIAPLVLRNEGVDVPIGRLVYAAHAPARPAPRAEAKPLPPNPLPERMDFRGAVRITLPLGATNEMSLEKPLFSVRRGRTVQLAVRNSAPDASVLHIHGHAVRLLDALDDGWKPFWLDTILCVPQQTTRVAFVADNPGKWLLHARGIGAERETIAWFEVT